MGRPACLTFCPLVSQSVLVQKAAVGDLQDRLSAAEEALAAKQRHIDDMKQEMFSKEEELQTISVFQAQVGAPFHF